MDIFNIIVGVLTMLGSVASFGALIILQNISVQQTKYIVIGAWKKLIT